ncbi:MAG: hypothetical protein OHK0012_24090 [Synechococcales cyanobacterium]
MSTLGIPTVERENRANSNDTLIWNQPQRISLGALLVGALLSPTLAYAEVIEVPIPDDFLQRQAPLTHTSVIDGRSLSPSEYAQEQHTLQHPDRDPPAVSPELQELVVLLRFRKLLRSVTPF